MYKAWEPMWFINMKTHFWTHFWKKTHFSVNTEYINSVKLKEDFKQQDPENSWQSFYIFICN